MAIQENEDRPNLVTEGEETDDEYLQMIKVAQMHDHISSVSKK